MESTTSLGELLRRWRKARDFTQEELARRAACATVTIRKIEADERRPSTDTAELLASALALPADARSLLRRCLRGEIGPDQLTPPVPGPDGDRWAGAPVGPRTNVPLATTRLIGRDREIAEVAAALGATRLLTVTGAGGCGKTRLALEVVRRQMGAYPDGVWLVELAPLSVPSLVPQAVATALGVHDAAGRPLLEAVIGALRARRVLLLLDNCEHLVDSIARLADAVLSSCPAVRIVATSREPLRIGGEVAWRVPGLATPPSDHRPFEELTQYASIQLFAERAAAALPSFVLSAENAPAVAQICRRLDGIPLAIELAAARVRVLSAVQIAARLDDRLQLLTGGSRTALPRQQTLRATLDWSDALLTDAERALFRRVSVFAGGFTLDAAEAIASLPVSSPGLDGKVCERVGLDCDAPPVGTSPPSGETLELVTQLVDKSLVLMEKRGDEARYRLLETVRQYGDERLVEVGETTTMRNRHAGWYIELAETAASTGLIGSHQLEWLERLEVEHDNVRVALAWCLDRAPDLGIRLAGSMWRFWRMRGFLAEGRVWLDRALDRSPEGSAHRARALLGAGILALEHADPQESRVLLAASAAWWRQAGAKGPLGHALHELGNCSRMLGEDVEQVRAIWNESLTLLREVGDERGVGCSLWFLGCLAAEARDDQKSKPLIVEAIQFFRRVGDLWLVSQALSTVGAVLLLEGDVPGARRTWEEQLELARRLGHPSGVGAALYLLAQVELVEDDPSNAGRLLRDGIRAFHQIGTVRIYDLLHDLGALAIRQGQPGRGVGLLATGVIGDSLVPPLWGPASWLGKEAEWDTILAKARSSLGHEKFARIWAEGKAMTLEQAASYALQENAD